jgi:hypothetical protein
MGDDGDDHRGHPVQQVAGHRGGAVAVIEHGQAQDDREGGGDEADPGGDQPAPAGPAEAKVDGQLGGTGAGDQVGRPDQVEELLLADPAAASHDFLVHEGDVGGGPPKAIVPSLRNSLTTSLRLPRSGWTSRSSAVAMWPSWQTRSPPDGGRPNSR